MALFYRIKILFSGMIRNYHDEDHDVNVKGTRDKEKGREIYFIFDTGKHQIPPSLYTLILPMRSCTSWGGGGGCYVIFSQLWLPSPSRCGVSTGKSPVLQLGFARPILSFVLVTKAVCKKTTATHIL